MITVMMILMVMIFVYFVTVITTKRMSNKIYDEQTRRRLSQRRFEIELEE